MKNKISYFLVAFTMALIFLQSCKKELVKPVNSLVNVTTSGGSNGINPGDSSSSYRLESINIGGLKVNDFTCFDGLNVNAVSTIPAALGYTVYTLAVQPGVSGQWYWQATSVQATSITSDFSNNLFITNSLGNIYKSESTLNGHGPWQQLSGNGSFVRCNNTNTDTPFAMYCLGTTMADANGYHIYKKDNNSGGWILKQGSAIKLAVEPNGTVWAINSGHQIFKSDSNGNNLSQMPGSATEIAIGGDSPSVTTIYCLGDSFADSNGYHIYKWVGNNWAQIDGSAVKISVSRTGTIVAANNNGNFFVRSRTDNFFTPL